MSLYSQDEICKGCVLAIFHKCCGSFCKCLEDYDVVADYTKGKCEYRKEITDETDA